VAGKLKRDLSTPENRKWWANIDRAAREARVMHLPRFDVFEAGFLAAEYDATKRDIERAWCDFVEKEGKDHAW
jgi:hypothetical protein